MEIWRAVPDSDFYQASSLGRVRSIDHLAEYKRRPGNHQKLMRGRVLKPFDNGKYLTVNIDGQTRCVHEIITVTFHGPTPAPDYQVRHRNGRRLENQADNLVWGTATQNQMDRFAHGTACEGENNYRAKLTELQVRQIMDLCATLGPTAIAKAVGCERHLVKHVVYGQSWNWLTQLPRPRHFQKDKTHGTI